MAAPLPVIVAPEPRDLDTILRSSHQRLTRLDLISGPAMGETLPIVGGSVTVDYASPIRRTASLTVVGVETWEPVDATSALDVRSGTEVQIWQGVRDDEGQEHWWSQGIYSVTRPSVSRSSSGLEISCDLTDRSHRVKLAGARRRWAASGSDYIIETVSAIIAQVAPWLPQRLDFDGDIPFGTDAIICEWGDDVLDKCAPLVRMVSRDLHVDRDGYLVNPPITDPLTATPVDLWGLTAMAVETDVEDVVNIVGCPWEEARPDDAPENWTPDGGVVEAVDEVTSTSVESPLGPRARTCSGDVSVVHTPDHAALAARADLNLRMGLARAASGSAIPDPRLDVGVAVSVDGATHVISRLGIDLGGGETSVDMGASRPDIAALISQQMRAPGEYKTTEIVTGLSPLRARSVTDPGGAEVTVTWTDALSGVEVGDPITVLHKGAGERVGVAILVHKTLQDKHAGEPVGTVGGRTLNAGQDAPLRARIGSSSSYQSFSGGDVTLPAPPAGASTTHYHNFSYPTISSPPGKLAAAQNNNVATIQGTRNVVNDLIDWANSVRGAFQANDSTGTPQG